MPAPKSNYYARLAVAPTATASELKKAFRKEAARLHPDKPDGDVNLFNALVEAYETLSDKTRRAQYDADPDTGGRDDAEEPDAAAAFGNSFGKNKEAKSLRGAGVKYEASVKAAAAPPPKSTFGRLNDRLKTESDVIKRPHESDGGFDPGFAAWLRNRNDQQSQVLTAESLVSDFGIDVVDYDKVPIGEWTRTTVARWAGFGEPVEVVDCEEEDLPKALEWNQVLVQMLGAPYNPQDALEVRGMLGVRKNRANRVVGSEGVGRVLRVGPGCKELVEGDYVVPWAYQIGTWRSLAILREVDLMKVSNELPTEYLANSRVMCTAYCLLENYADLAPGDSVIINAANSSVGQCLIQMATILKINVVGVIRARDDFDAVEADLLRLGAKIVFKEGSATWRTAIDKKGIALPRVAFDAVGGPSGMALFRSMRPGGVHVIYGGLSLKPLSFSSGAFINSDLTIKGFRFNKWLEDNGKEAFAEALEKVGVIIKSGRLKLPILTVPMRSGDFAVSMARGMGGKTSHKILWVFPDAMNAITLD